VLYKIQFPNRFCAVSKIKKIVVKCFKFCQSLAYNATGKQNKNFEILICGVFPADIFYIIKALGKT
jgi:hypothetical protein